MFWMKKYILNKWSGTGKKGHNGLCSKHILKAYSESICHCNSKFVKMLVWYDSDNDNDNILFDHNIQIYTTDLQ